MSLRGERKYCIDEGKKCYKNWTIEKPLKVINRMPKLRIWVQGMKDKIR